MKKIELLPATKVVESTDEQKTKNRKKISELKNADPVRHLKFNQVMLKFLYSNNVSLKITCLS